MSSIVDASAWELKTWRNNESSEKVLEEIKCLFSEASINIPDACIDRAHRVSKTDDTVIVPFTTFRHRTMFYRKRKELKNGVKVHLDLTKARLDLLIKARKYVKNLSNVDFVYADLNCWLKIHFSNNNESFFDSMDDLRFFKWNLVPAFYFNCVFLFFCNSNDISIGGVSKGGYVEAVLFAFQQALWGMSLWGFIFREVVGFKDAEATCVKIATEMKKCSRLKEMSNFNVLWNFQPI